MLADVTATAQEHVSHRFRLVAEMTLSSSSCAYQPGRILGCVDGPRLYLCRSEVEHQRGRGCLLEVEEWNLLSETCRTIQVPLPEPKRNLLGVRKYWLSALAVADGSLALATHDRLFLFEIRKDATCRLSQALAFPDADFPFWDDGKAYAVAQVNDDGFLLSACTDKRLDSVARFPLPAPFLLQFAPNTLLKPLGGNVYLLPTPEPVLQRYDLHGNPTGELRLHIPRWNPMPADYRQTVSAMPYGGDRALHIFNSCTPYSFPLEVFPMNDTTFLLSCHQYDSARARRDIFLYRVQTDRAWSAAVCEPLAKQFAADHRMATEEYPFCYADRALRLMTGGRDMLVQVVKSSDEPYVGRTETEYAAAQETFFAQSPPQLKVRALRPAESAPQVDADQLALTDFSGGPFAMDSIPTRRALFIVNRPPQCHACEEGLIDFANTLDLGDCSLYVVESRAVNALARRESLEKLHSRLQLPFTPLFPMPAEEGELMAVIGDCEYPVILLWDRQWKTLTRWSGAALYPDNPWEAPPNGQARDFIRSFAARRSP